MARFIYGDTPMDIKRLIGIWIVVIVGAAVLMVGCSKNSEVTQVGAMMDQEALQQQVAQLDTAEFATMPMTLFPSHTNADSIYPVRWGRRIDWKSVVRNYQVLIDGDTIAYVTITKTIPGRFLVAWGTRLMGMVTIDTVISKPFSESVVRKVEFRRTARNRNPLVNWVPVAITMVDGKTPGVNAFTIDSLEISDSQMPFNRTITDPLTTWFQLGLLHGRLPIFPTRDSVYLRLTITSTDTSNEMVFLRHGIGGGHLEHRRAKMNLVSSTYSSGVYTRVYDGWFRTGLPVWALLAERFNATVDVVSRGSIYSMDAPFSNEYWGAPYIVSR
jgi:hypothetical protein